jgi:GT2 family glycosyltransferase
MFLGAACHTGETVPEVRSDLARTLVIHLGDNADKDAGLDVEATDADSGHAVTELSVVLPCFNGADHLREQLDALAAQDWTLPFEVIVADNGSSDGSRDLALAYRDRIAVRVVDASDRQGRHHACNVGARAARAASIVFVDADDVVAPNYLSAMAAALRDHSVVAARLDHKSLDAEWMDGVGSAVQTKGLQDAFAFLPHGAGCSLGFQRAVFERIGGFREHATYCEDVDISWRAQLAGYAIAFVPDALVHYRSRTNVKEMYQQHRKYGRAQAILYRDFRASGMPRRSAAAVRADWSMIVKSLPRLRSHAQTARWARRAGRCIGRLEGSARLRVWYP